MLDVHPVHVAVHSWRDFFVHIATISVGLLIAVGLEQTVEYVHHRHQLSEARRELATELDENVATLERNTKEGKKILADMDANVAVLRAVTTAHSTIGKDLVYETHFGWPDDGPWQSIKQNGLLGLMPHAEMRKLVYFHEVIAYAMDAATQVAINIELAAAIVQRAPDGNLTPRDIDELMSVTSKVRGSATFLLKILHYESNALDQARR